MEELEPSELGSQDYWEGRYAQEIRNFSSHGDPGEIWFGEDIVDRVIRWINNWNLIEKNKKIVDVGCGNGMFLIELANEGYTNLTGVDYSENAIKLATEIAQKQNLNISYYTCDILQGLPENYDIIHDKGTYDAISLSENAKESRAKYSESVYNSLDGDGVFILTSCNWTQDELDNYFNEKFDRLAIIPTPQFKFGGKVGNVVTSCVYKKKS
ncbi:EEF1A lysine methyltransferase 2 [Diorhabda carinulata]|uniref:EEF1A lysine methyltransferase 2 n=1 Tax=Diorhabda sublineata TaxID=1163346 RepID=UPI0024E197E2|nr:EEF1A lysine methyltransferase 2 [Diorhabda sublineata]XP_057652145.1 EEF1A lysine methyltransferase 2 [Diorhabda carinulata]